MRAIWRVILSSLFRVRITGDAGVLASGRRLIVANHESLLDGVFLALFLPGSPSIVVERDGLRHPLARLFGSVIRFVVIDRTRPLSIKTLIDRVSRGERVVIFPQARLSTTGGLMKVDDAAGVIAMHSDVEIVPVHIAGTLYSRASAATGPYRRRWFPRVTLTVLPPVRLPRIPGRTAKERRRRSADAMMKVMQQMFFDARPPQTLFEAFVDAVELHGRRRTIIEDVREKPETYGEVLKTTLAVARLASKVTADREVVGVMLPNLSTTVALVLGLTAMRRVAAMLNYSGGAEGARAACVSAGVNTVLTSRRFVEAARLDSIVRALDGVKIIYLEDLRSQLTARDKLWLVAHALRRPRAAVPRADPSDVAVVLFTSGSEARSKGVAISHHAILAGIAQLRAVIDFGPGDKFFNALPMYHTYGLSACTLMPILSGTPLFLYTTPLHYRHIPELVYSRNCTALFGTSTFLGQYARLAHPYDFYSLRIVVSGGEKLNAEVTDLWAEKFGLRVLEGYGATECGPAMALNTPLAYRRGTVGRFLPGVETRLVQVPGIGDGAGLHVRSPSLMSGYYFYEQPGVLHPPRSEVGVGWYNTGDVVDVDDEGFVTIVGRVKRFAKIAGEMVSLELVERIAYTASPAHKHAATVEQVSGRGESTLLFTTDPSLDTLKLAQAAQRIEAQERAVPRRIVKVASLPLLGSGKTDYVMLTRMAAGATA